MLTDIDDAIDPLISRKDVESYFAASSIDWTRLDNVPAEAKAIEVRDLPWTYTPLSLSASEGPVNFNFDLTNLQPETNYSSMG